MVTSARLFFMIGSGSRRVFPTAVGRCFRDCVTVDASCHIIDGDDVVDALFVTTNSKNAAVSP
ncbi:hypothetical protein [Rhodococcus sp. USK13]|uniref:hypothetical protein n=1 Tax=Rhodococcus sp. USK13 TaxID=2806442 RepID=UPI001BCBA019|nr:hypothetical protein [Rhodococcus sp. USK13]